jgi:hypothetical protein
MAICMDRNRYIDRMRKAGEDRHLGARGRACHGLGQRYIAIVYVALLVLVLITRAREAHVHAHCNAIELNQ